MSRGSRVPSTSSLNRPLAAVLTVALAGGASACAQADGAGRGAAGQDAPGREVARRPASGGAPLRLPLADPRIVVKKGERRLYLLSGSTTVREYPVALGSNPDVDKEVEGDRATPLGDFYVAVKNPKSRYYLSLGISYPNAEDAERGLREGLITEAERRQIVEAIARGRMPPQKTRLGGEIYIHGRGSSPDWTLGCVALDDDAMRELYDATPVGTPVRIEP